MDVLKRGIFLMSLLGLLVTIVGCDLLSPKPKSTAKVIPTVKASTSALTTTAADSPQVGKNEPLPANVLAKVGSWSITIDEFNQRMEGVKQVIKGFDEKNLQSKEMVLDELIRQQLLVYEARQQKLDETKDIQAAVKDFENTLIVQELAAQLTKDIKATEKEASDYYNANPDVFIAPVEKKLTEIVLLTQAEAKDILVQVLQGGDFAQLAKEKSKGKSATSGGDLGWVAKAPFERMQKEIDDLKKGDISKVFEGPEGFYIVKVEDVRGGDKKAFGDVKEDLMKGLTLQKQQMAVLEKIGEVAKKINIQVNAELLKGK